MRLATPFISLIAVLSLVTFPSTRTALAAAEAPQTGGLKIVVIAGEDAVNVIQQKTSVAPIVEVRDRNNLPVAGAVVVFAVPAGKASLNNGLQQVTVATDASGRATVSVNPLSRGGLDIQVRATYQGQTATTTVRQANVATAAEAGQTMNPNAAAAGGLSAAALAGIIGGAGAGAAVAIKAAGGKPGPPNQTPVVASVTANPPAAIAGTNTSIAFSAQASDADNNPLTYTWDFGDGTTGSGPTPTHTYAALGTFTVKVTVNDGKASATSQTTVPVRPFAGTWSLPGTLTMTFNQSASSFTGTGVYTSLQGFGGVGPGTITNGTLRGSSPRITFTFTFAQNVPFGCVYSWTETYSGDPTPDANMIQLTVVQTITPGSGACGLGVRTTTFQTLLLRQ